MTWKEQQISEKNELNCLCNRHSIQESCVIYVYVRCDLCAFDTLIFFSLLHLHVSPWLWSSSSLLSSQLYVCFAFSLLIWFDFVKCEIIIKTVGVYFVCAANYITFMRFGWVSDRVLIAIDTVRMLVSSLMTSVKCVNVPISCAVCALVFFFSLFFHLKFIQMTSNLNFLAENAIWF